VREVLRTLVAQRLVALARLEMVLSLLVALEQPGCRMADRCQRQNVNGSPAAAALGERLSLAAMFRVACQV